MALHPPEALSDCRIGEVFKALADPTRLSVIERLSKGSASMTELAQSHQMTLPSFAQHLRVLEQSGLLQSAKQGRERRYRLVPTCLIMVEDWLGKQRAIWEQRLDRLELYVEGMKNEKGSEGNAGK
jgi:DNA-binding transcriptional ArsR family regulator